MLRASIVRRARLGLSGVVMVDGFPRCRGGHDGKPISCWIGAKGQFNGQFRGKTLLSDLFLTRYTLREIPLLLVRWASGAECSLLG